jgi:hypothetical protein
MAKSITDAGQSALDDTISSWLTCDMNVKLRQIEVDEETAALFEAGAAAWG